jgi:hypothetical protein
MSWTTAQGTAKSITSLSSRRRLLGLGAPDGSTTDADAQVTVDSRFWIERIGRARIDAAVRAPGEIFLYQRFVDATGSRLFVDGAPKGLSSGGEHMVHWSDIEVLVRASHFVPTLAMAGRSVKKLGREAREYLLDPRQLPDTGLRSSLFAHQDHAVVTVDVESGIWLSVLVTNAKGLLWSQEMMSLALDDPIPLDVFELPSNDQPEAMGSIVGGESIADIAKLAPFGILLPVLPQSSRVALSYVQRPLVEDCEVWIHVDFGDFYHYLGMSQRQARADRFLSTGIVGSSWSRVIGTTEVVAESNLAEDTFIQLMDSLQPVTS